VPVVEDGAIARCRRCRAYINPFVYLTDGGTRWKCALCNVRNEVPAAFGGGSASAAGAAGWVGTRAELTHAVVDFVAPREYTTRPPQAVCYVFLIDVGAAARANGMLRTAARAIARALDDANALPNTTDGSTRVAFVAFDARLHFVHFHAAAAEFTVMVVADVQDQDGAYLPRPAGLLLVNLRACRPAIDALLARFEDIFDDGASSGSAMGPALQAGFQLIVRCGSVFCFRPC
jgi:protein transport protein SEC24